MVEIVAVVGVVMAVVIAVIAVVVVACRVGSGIEPVSRGRAFGFGSKHGFY